MRAKYYKKSSFRIRMEKIHGRIQDLLAAPIIWVDQHDRMWEKAEERIDKMIYEFGRKLRNECEIIKHWFRKLVCKKYITRKSLCYGKFGACADLNGIRIGDVACCRANCPKLKETVITIDEAASMNTDNEEETK